MILRSICLFTVLLCSAAASSAYAVEKTIYGVFWNGCEEVCQGFQNYFAENQIDINFVIRDAARDWRKLPQFLFEARSLGVDLILTYGTSVTLGIAGTYDDPDGTRFNHDIPHVFAAVADPVGSKIVKSLETTGRKNVTGTFNRVPEAVNIHTIRSYLPSFKKLGLLYNTNERNSVLKQQELSRLSNSLAFDLVAIAMPLAANGKPNAEDIPGKVTELKQKGVDFIYVGSSSFLDVNRGVFTSAAIENGLPVLSPYERMVRNSRALLSISARYFDVGRLAGGQAWKILKENQTPGDIPVVRATDFAYVVNMAVARELNLFPPVEILRFAETVN
jgi:putative ABC transport system substrate-binding protein